MQNKVLIRTTAPVERTGVGFIKSRKSDDKVMDISEKLIKMAAKKGINIIEVIADRTSGIDIDRYNVDRLVAWMEKSSIDTIVVRNIFDISNDLDDLLVFLMRAAALDVEVLSMYDDFKSVSLPLEGEFE